MSFRIRGRFVFFFAVALVAGLTFSPGQASATHVSCGDVITQDTTLDSDLGSFSSPCPGVGIVIGADNITLDLNGHFIFGRTDGEQVGVDNTAGHDGVTVKNGLFPWFRYCVKLSGARANRIGGLACDGSIRLIQPKHH